MSKIGKQLINENIQVEISGKKFISGFVIDFGSDTMVLYNGKDYVYIPIVHIQHIRKNEADENDIARPKEPASFVEDNDKDEVSLRKVLTEAKGMYVEIFVMGSKPLHGYITSIMNNYFVFHSPIYKTMYITLYHLKWLTPYSQGQTPYDLKKNNFPNQPANLQLARTFLVQIERFKDKLAVFNIGENDNYIGKINKVEGSFIEIQLARSRQPVYINMQHIKTLHLV
ncbi:DUF2642 domain-containing protein [Virgibacillus halodenitrificans]|uniref:DUF2642 domain-containing protein n=1 Tax=Virgibacillus halodenitrificans TaxID=1482 RepID=UPI002DBEA434|nr:DUF2642 domain-containing protein [Virgibacillus halodenitrificans]MEC2159379.1 DUF2642 domain-containing protein [Virgibacillus halodenitrificans]